MPVDFGWSSTGGIIMSASGDIGLTTSQRGTQQLICSRLKAALNGWKLYAIGADLESFHGTVIDQSLQSKIKMAVIDSLSNQFLPSGSFQVQTLTSGTTITIFVFINSILAAQATLSSNGSVTTQAS